MTAPNGGETWAVNSKQNITWSTIGNIQRVTIQYCVDGGTNWFMVASDIANANTYAWTVPDDISANCLVKISEARTGYPHDRSDAPFTISAAGATQTRGRKVSAPSGPPPQGGSTGSVRKEGLK